MAADTHLKKVGKSPPELAGAHYNLGVLYFSQGNFAGAELAYRQAGAITPEDPDIFFNLALTMKKMGRLAEAKNQYEKVLSITASDLDTHYNLGILLKEMDAPEEAINSFEKAIALDPAYLSAHKYLAGLYQQLGLNNKAIASYRKIMELHPPGESARHMMEALEGTTSATCPLSYAKELFDQFSDHFDETMRQKLACTIPDQLRMVMDRHSAAHSFTRGLDMGCGTGLSGVAFTDCVERLAGIDLSAKMLARAREKEVYGTLDEIDIISFLQNTAETFDLFLAADVFIYLADLKPVFDLTRKRARRNAVFLFSTEICRRDYRLQPCGRYAQAASYISSLAADCGFTIRCCQAADLRREKGKWARGNLFLLTV